MKHNYLSTFISDIANKLKSTSFGSYVQLFLCALLAAIFLKLYLDKSPVDLEKLQNASECAKHSLLNLPPTIKPITNEILFGVENECKLYAELVEKTKVINEQQKP